MLGRLLLASHMARICIIHLRKKSKDPATKDPVDLHSLREMTEAGISIHSDYKIYTQVI